MRIKHFVELNKIMKNLKIVLLLFLAMSVSSQQLDEEFLESLPDDIRKDIQENNQRKLINPTYIHLN